MRMSDPIGRLSRRALLKAAAAGAAVAAAGPLAQPLLANAPPVADVPETVVKTLYQSLSEKQRGEICFAWDYKEKARGLLRSYLSNNWRITRPAIKSEFFTADQQAMIRQIFEGLVNPDWVQRFDKQFK